MCVEAGNVLQGTEQLVLLLLAHVESGTTVKAAADHHAGDRGLDGCAAVPTEAPLTVPVLPRGSFRSPVGSWSPTSVSTQPQLGLKPDV